MHASQAAGHKKAENIASERQSHSEACSGPVELNCLLLGCNA